MNKKALQNYLEQIFGESVKLVSVSTAPPGSKASSGPKGFGYGQPLFLEYLLKGRRERAVLETLRGDGFGHEYLADRAHSVILAHSTFRNLPKHAESIDAGIITENRKLRTVGEAEEYFQLVRFIEGREYFHDLERIKQSGKLTALDLRRARALADYLASVHMQKEGKPELYVRRIRELVGHGECIMGLTDSYPPPSEFALSSQLEEIERKCIVWRWRLKQKTARVSRIHGDFHPWNILFRKGTDFSLIDRSRGEWGEPADDIAALTINYLFFSLQAYGDFRPPFLNLWQAFYSRYLAKTGDTEFSSVIQPFFAWRALVLASPIWYPNLPDKIRRTLFNFIHGVLDVEKFDYEAVKDLLVP